MYTYSRCYTENTWNFKISQKIHKRYNKKHYECPDALHANKIIIHVYIHFVADLAQHIKSC